MNIFIFLTFLCVAVLHYCEIFSTGMPVEGILTTPKLIRRNGYPVEEIKVTTSDGYRLRIFRMSGRKGAQASGARGTPVLLVHGALTSSCEFIIHGPKKSLGYILADAGYDVFLGNLRFTHYASHVNKSKNNADYWDFGIEELGLYDVPAMIEGVLGSSTFSGLHYIGYSHGATSYIITCSIRPDLAAKILSFVGLAPTVYVNHLKPIAQLLLRSNILNKLNDRGLNTFFAGGRIERALIENLCSAKNSSDDICNSVMFVVGGEDYDQVNWKLSPARFAQMMPATMKQLIHTLQMSMTDEMTRYDYGREENMIHYGTASPPKFNMTANLAPVTLFYGNNDGLSTTRDVLRLQKTLGGPEKRVEAFAVPLEKFNHYDFIMAKDVGILLNRDVLKALDKYDPIRGKNSAN